VREHRVRVLEEQMLRDQKWAQKVAEEKWQVVAERDAAIVELESERKRAEQVEAQCNKMESDYYELEQRLKTAESLVESLTVGSKCMDCGILQAAEATAREFCINDYTNKATCKAEICGMNRLCKAIAALEAL